jgi:uncharacterized protein (DUF2384 family)
MRDLTTEEIMAAVPDVIDVASISLNAMSKLKPHRRRVGNAKKRWWRANDRIRGATTYALVGNASEVERITGIPSGTIRQWKTQDWWPQIIERIRLEADDELDVKFTKVVDRAIDLVVDRIEKGDYIYDPNRAQMVRKPISARDGTTVVNTFLDKRQLLRQKKDARMEESTITDRLKKLADEFEKFTKMRVIEGEVVETEERSPIQGQDPVQTKEVLTKGPYKSATNTLIDYINQARPELKN